MDDDTYIKREDEDLNDPRLLQKMLSQLKCLVICKYMLEQSQEVKDTLFSALNVTIAPFVVVTRQLNTLWLIK